MHMNHRLENRVIFEETVALICVFSKITVRSHCVQFSSASGWTPNPPNSVRFFAANFDSPPIFVKRFLTVFWNSRTFPSNFHQNRGRIFQKWISDSYPNFAGFYSKFRYRFSSDSYPMFFPISIRCVTDFCPIFVRVFFTTTLQLRHQVWN